MLYGSVIENRQVFYGKRVLKQRGKQELILLQILIWMHWLPDDFNSSRIIEKRQVNNTDTHLNHPGHAAVLATSARNTFVFQSHGTTRLSKQRVFQQPDKLYVLPLVIILNLR
jgi:hypothetical protein